jgi:hypothetical protein
VNGKRKDFYLGTGNGKDDWASYDRALAKWKIKEAELNAQEAEDALQSAYAKWGESLAARDGIDGSVCASRQTLITLPEQRLYGEELHPSLQRWLDGTARLGEDRPPTPPKPKEKLIDAHIDDYLAEQRERYEHGLKFPDAPQHERISPARFIAYQWTANTLKQNWTAEPLPKDEAGLESLMERFRKDQKRLMTTGTIKPATFNERIKTMRHFVGYLYRKRIIASIPRETERLCSKHKIKTTARALTVEMVRQLFSEGLPRLKTYIALGLNCGFYAVDIANLQHSHIKDGYIVCDRHKTGVPTRFKLWEVTKRLLAENCNGTGDLAFVTNGGGPLLVVDPDEEGRGKRWCQIDNDLFALRNEAFSLQG